MDSEKIKELIYDCDMLLVGIGSRFGKPFHTEKDRMDLNTGKILYREISENKYDFQIQLYNMLADLIGKKNYFIVDTNYDGLIYKSKLNEMRIVTPCGNIFKIQCGCSGESGIHDAGQIYSGNEPLKCQVCGMEYLPNVHGVENYNENGYLKKWDFYNKWLAGTLNKNLTILELGSDFKYASIIRWPFEKITLINNKASLIRVNDMFPQGTPEIKDKIVSLKTDVETFIKSI